MLKYYLTACVFVIGVCCFACLFKAIRGPRFTDRMVMVNAITTMVVAVIVILAARLEESYLIDVAVVYALLGFLSNAVLCRIAAFRVYGKKLHKDDGESI